METRTEHDSLGPVDVPADKYWGAQTQRSLENFKIGDQTMPRAMIRALGIVKYACAEVNSTLGLLEQPKKEAIQRAAQEVIDGEHDDQFPLVVWQTGSGTQTNMNANEVIANRAIEILGGEIGTKKPVHPNDDVNMSQSTNDSFPTVTHVAAVERLKGDVLPALRQLRDELAEKAEAFQDVIKVGRTHLMDATPIRFGQEFSGYVAQIDNGIEAIEDSLDLLKEVPIGGTAVGTGLNTREGFDEEVAAVLSDKTGYDFRAADNKFSLLAGKEAIVEAHSALATTATALKKVATDVRWMSSGPRCGLQEIDIPANEPGSSIMPGKINPTQAEAMTMVCTQVLGNNTTVTQAASEGNFELNVNKPLLAHNLIESSVLIADASRSFTEKCIAGLEINEKQVNQYLEQSLMLVTALNTEIGYDKAAEVAKKAHKENISLKESVVELGYLDEETFDRIVDPSKMVGPTKRDTN